MSEIRIGLDIGTTCIKAAAYHPQGACIAQAERMTNVIRPHPGFAEQDMQAVWQAVLDCLGEIGRACAGKRVVSLGICAQGDGFWAIDAQGQPVGNAILWSDTRSTADLEALSKAHATDAIGTGSGTAIWPGSSGMIWRWLKAHKPGQAQRVSTVFTCADWIGYRLTGELATDFANASIPFLDLDTRAYEAAQLEAIGCADLGEKLIPPRQAQEPLGQLSAPVAQMTGLPENLPVSVGTLDLAAMTVGMALDHPGQTLLIMGTTAVVTILTDKTERQPRPAGASTLHPTSRAILRIFAPSTGAAAFDWFTALHPTSLGGETPGEVAQKLNALVREVPAGANGVTFLPYLNGERAPFVSPDLRGGFHGLSASTTKADLGRAVMEGTALSLRHCFESHSGLPAQAVQLTGGGSKNPVWCQIIADIIGQDVSVSRHSDHGLWGAAAIGAAAAGSGEAIELARRDEKVITYKADPQVHQAYTKIYQRYETISRAMQTLQEKLNSLKDQTS